MQITRNVATKLGLSFSLFILAGTLSAAITDDLVFYVPFTSDMDDMQNGQIATVKGDATRQSAGGLVGDYLHLHNDAATPDQSIDFPDVPIGASDFSVSIWVRSSDPSPGQAQPDVALISNKDWDSGGNYGWVLARGAGGANPRLQWNFSTPAGSRADFDPADANAAVFDGNWHHIAVIHARAGNASFYVDGVLIGTVDISGNANGDINAAGLRLSLGNDGTGGYDHGDGSTYNGDLDEAALWTRALTPGEVNEIYSAGLQGLGLYDTSLARAFFKDTLPAQSANNAPGNTPIGATIQAGVAPINQESIKMFVDGAEVTPSISLDGVDLLLRYEPAQILAPGSTHTVRIEAADSGTPPWSITNSWSFTVIGYTVLSANNAWSGNIVSTAPGFKVRSAINQATGLDGTLARAIAQLDGTLIDPNTSEPYANLATPGPNPDGSQDSDTTINFDQAGIDAGLFTGDQVFPGLAAADNDYFAFEAAGYLELAAGYHRFGVTSDDGFAVRVGNPPQGLFTSTAVGLFDGPRSPAESTFDFFAPVAGYYPFSLVFFEIAGGANCEFYSIDLATGERTLINDPANPNAIRSVCGLVGVSQPPFVRSVDPQPNAADVKVDTAITVLIVDGDSALNPSTLELLLNGVSTPVTAARNGRVTTVTAQPANSLAYKTAYTVTLTFSNGGAHTNQWQFTTRPADQKPSITGQWDFDQGDLSATIGQPLQYLDGASGASVAQTQFGTTTSFGIPNIRGVPAKVLRFGGAINRQIGYLMTHEALPNGGDTPAKVNQWTLIMDILIPNSAGQGWFSFGQLDSLDNSNDAELFANFSGGTGGLGISGSYPKDPPIVAGHWHRVTFAVDAAGAISKYVDGAKQADQTSWSGQGFDCRHALLPTAILFADEDGESQPAFINSIQFRNYKLSDEAVATLGGPAAEGIPTVSGQWDFESGDLRATIGSDLLYRTADTFATEFETSSIDGEQAGIMHFYGISPTDGYFMWHGASPNGGGLKVNQYSLILDILYPSSSTGYRALWQTETNAETLTDGDLFVNGANALGISSAYQGSLTPDAWHRVVFTLDLTRRELGKYIDGANVQTAATGASPPADAGPYQYLSTSTDPADSGGIDGRWSLSKGALLFADEDGELNEGFVNSIQFRAGVLTPAQVAMLGGPAASGIPCNFPLPAKLSILRQEGNLLVSWSEALEGYVLESSPTLGPSAVWTEVANATLLNGQYTSVQTPGGTTMFFRLRK